MEPMYKGSITDVQGILVGQEQDFEAQTGVTVVLCEGEGAVVSAEARGAAPGTRETDLCQPENTVQKANAVVLTGGSAYGLGSADGVMSWLEGHGFGVDMTNVKVPIVPAAALYDLGVGNPHIRPDAAMAGRACENASRKVLQGSYGAGCGATVGKLCPEAIPAKGGIGTASLRLPCGVTVAAIAAVNACGDIINPEDGSVLACGHMKDGTPALLKNLLLENADSAGRLVPNQSGKNTTISVVATDAVLTKVQAKRLAVAAHDGYARAIFPVHTAYDGDTVFALSTGKCRAEVGPVELATAACEVMARAILNAVQMGNGL